MSEQIRIGHRGLEYRQVDDTYWLNGTNIDAEVYNQELQRIITHEDGRRTAQQIQHEAMQNNARQQQLNIERLARMQAAAAQAQAYGFSFNYPRLHGRPTTAQSDQSGERARADSAKAAQAANKALEGKRRKSAEAEKPCYSLKNSPLFGKAAFGPFYNWTFDSPFTRLHRWAIRWAWNFQRRQARAS